MGVVSAGGRRAAAVEPALTTRLSDELLRQRLIDRMAARWIRSVTVVEAAGGYGKSTMIAQAIRDNAADPTGLDVYHPCRPLDREAANLAARVLDAFGADVATSGQDADQLADLVAGQIAARAPTVVCLTLDDLHHCADSEEAVRLLSRLLRTLPANGHLVLAGRTLPKLPLSRLAAADDLALVGPDELAFDADEMATLAARHGVDPSVLTATAGWPVMARLAIVAGAGSSLDFLFEEVVDGLDGGTRAAVAAAALGRRIDDGLLEQVGTPVRTAELLAVPLISDLGSGWIGTHDLWIEALDQLVPPDRLAEIATTVARWHRAGNRYDEAIQVAAQARAWPEAKATIMAALAEGDAMLSAGRTERWQHLFPADLQDEPELCLLRAMTARLAEGHGAGDLEAERALERFREEGGSPADVMAAVMEVGFCAWLRGDVARVFDMYSLAVEHRDAGLKAGEPLIALGEHGMADLSGDAAKAREVLDGVDLASAPTPIALLVLRARSTMCFLLGESAAGVEAAEALLERADNDGIRLIVAAAHWQHGDPEPLRGRWLDLRNPAHDNTRDDFLGRVFSAVIDASLGIVADVSALAELSTGRSREQAFVALATAASLVAAGREADAAAAVEALADTIGVDDPLCRGELRRFLPYGYLLSPRVRAALDADDLGPKLAERRSLARLLVAARDGGPAEWRSLPSPPEVLCALPLAWSIEVAAHAAGAGHGAAAPLELAEYLIDFTGSPAQEHLRRLADGGGLAAPGALAILATVPAPPRSTTSVRAAGPLDVRAAGVDRDLLRRARVRELLGLLVLRRRISTDEAIDALWPDLPPERGRNNLRITLTFLRRLLEPDRHSGEASFHIRRRGDEIWLHRSPFLEVDLWEMHDRIDRGRSLERAGQVAEAIDEYRAAVERWSDPVLLDLRHNGATAAEVVAIDGELANAAARVAEWTLAQGTTSEAIEAAGHLLRHDPYAERAHSVLVSAHLADEDLEAASLAVTTLTSVLDELAVAPAPDTAMVLRRFERRRATEGVS